MNTDLLHSPDINCYNSQQLADLRRSLTNLSDLDKMHPGIADIFKYIADDKNKLHFLHLEKCFYYLKNYYSNSHNVLQSLDIDKLLTRLYQTAGRQILINQFALFYFKIDEYLKLDSENNPLRKDKQELAKQLKNELIKVEYFFVSNTRITIDQYKQALWNYHHLIAHALHETVKMNVSYNEKPYCFANEESGEFYALLDERRKHSASLLANIFFEIQDAAVCSDKVRDICYQLAKIQEIGGETKGLQDDNDKTKKAVEDYFKETDSRWFQNKRMSEVNKKLLKTMVYLTLDLRDTFTPPKKIDLQHPKVIRLIAALDFCLHEIDKNISEINSEFLWFVLNLACNVALQLLSFPHLVHTIAHFTDNVDLIVAETGKLIVEGNHSGHEIQHVQHNPPILKHGRTFAIIKNCQAMLLDQKNQLNATISYSAEPLVYLSRFDANNAIKADPIKTNDHKEILHQPTKTHNYNFFSASAVLATIAGGLVIPHVALATEEHQLILMMICMVIGASLFGFAYLNTNLAEPVEKPCLALKG